jgi:hypothetical protein
MAKSTVKRTDKGKITLTLTTLHRTSRTKLHPRQAERLAAELLAARFGIQARLIVEAPRKWRTQPEFMFVSIRRTRDAGLPRVRDPRWGKIMGQAWDEHVAAGKIKPLPVEQKPKTHFLLERHTPALNPPSQKHGTGSLKYSRTLLAGDNGAGMAGKPRLFHAS